MKIVHFLYEMGSGGAERFVADLANAQAASGHEVSVVMLRPSNEKTCFNSQFLDKGISFKSLGVARGINFKKLKQVKKSLLSEKADILHCHHNILPYIALVLLPSAKPLIIHTVHSAAERANKNAGERIYCKFLYKTGLVKPVTISEESRRSFIKVYGMDAPCINNGRADLVKSPAFESVTAEIDAFKQNPGTRVFIHVGRCHPVKNQKLLIDAFNALDDEGVDFTLIVLGDGFDSDFGKSIKERACSKIHFVGEKSNVADYLMNSDAFCLTSLSEGLSVSLIEALQCGLTPICTPVGGNPDVVKDGETGYLSKDLSLESYLDAIKRYFVFPLSRGFLKEYFFENYSMNHCCKDYLSLYSDLLLK